MLFTLTHVLSVKSWTRDYCPGREEQQSPHLDESILFGLIAR